MAIRSGLECMYFFDGLHCSSCGMYVWVCVCVGVYIYIYIYVWLSEVALYALFLMAFTALVVACMCVCMCLCRCMSVRSGLVCTIFYGLHWASCGMYVSVCMYGCGLVCTLNHTYIHKYIRTYIHTYIHTYTYTHIHTCIQLSRNNSGIVAYQRHWLRIINNQTQNIRYMYVCIHVRVCVYVCDCGISKALVKDYK